MFVKQFNNYQVLWSIFTKKKLFTDLKSANILCESNENAAFNFKLADFGIAKQLVMNNKNEVEYREK